MVSVFFWHYSQIIWSLLLKTRSPFKADHLFFKLRKNKKLVKAIFKIWNKKCLYFGTHYILSFWGRSENTVFWRHNRKPAVITPSACTYIRKKSPWRLFGAGWEKNFSRNKSERLFLIQNKKAKEICFWFIILLRRPRSLDFSIKYRCIISTIVEKLYNFIKLLFYKLLLTFSELL